MNTNQTATTVTFPITTYVAQYNSLKTREAAATDITDKFRLSDEAAAVLAEVRELGLFDEFSKSLHAN